MEELTSWKIISTLLVLISGGVIYWRKAKDKADEDLRAKDEELGKEIKAVSKESKVDIGNLKDAVNTHLDENQKQILTKIEEVLGIQNSMNLKIEKAFIRIEQHTTDLSRLGNRQEKHQESINSLEKSEAVNVEWKKRVEEKLKMS